VISETNYGVKDPLQNQFIVASRAGGERKAKQRVGARISSNFDNSLMITEGGDSITMSETKLRYIGMTKTPLPEISQQLNM